jgi:hypothetical protein
MLRDLLRLARALVGSALVHAGRAVAPEPEEEDDDDLAVGPMPLGHPVVALSDTSRRMIAEGVPAPVHRRVERPAPLIGSAAARYGSRR